MYKPEVKEKIEVVLIGGGIMSATLATLLYELMPNVRMAIYERLDKTADESSQSWNNAGTGHSAFCELNYTPMDEQGNINCSKAIKIAEQFEISKQFYSYIVDKGIVEDPSDFINQTPHYSFVQGEKDIAFLKKRHEAMIKNPLFSEMEYSEDHAILREWIPLMMEGRGENEKVAATRMEIGTDVNFGTLTNKMFEYLQEQGSANVFVNHEVRKINRNEDGTWEIKIKNQESGEKFKVDARFVFVGAGGGALKLLNKAGVNEVDGYGGFPVGGKWLKCINPEVISCHHAKVYGQAEVGAPPMSVPHLDSRMINGERQMLFGPYAGFSTKFLKHGSLWDLPSSLDFDNLMPMIEVGIYNIPLTKYLIEQVRMNFHEKFAVLKKFYPTAKEEDWELIEAGQRVQIIKKNEHGDGILEFGTELIATKDGTLAGLLGASPGASTATSIMIKLLNKCFAQQIATGKYDAKLQEIFPSYGVKLNHDKRLLNELRERTENTLFNSLAV